MFLLVHLKNYCLQFVFHRRITFVNTALDLSIPYYKYLKHIVNWGLQPVSECCKNYIKLSVFLVNSLFFVNYPSLFFVIFKNNSALHLLHFPEILIPINLNFKSAYKDRFPKCPIFIVLNKLYL